MVVEASVGLASINSTDVKTEKTGNGLEIGLKRSKGRVRMIGKFPGYARFKGIAKEF